MESRSLLALLSVLILASSLVLADGGNVNASEAGKSNSLTTTQKPIIPEATTPAMSDGDEPDGDNGSAIRDDLQRINSTSTKKEDDTHTFYQPEYITDADRAMAFWVDFSKLPSNSSVSFRHEMLSKSYRRAAPIKLSFEFPFYGHPLKNIILATGGFLYVGEHLHHWLAATQNISPLMANFDLSTSNYSNIYHYDNGTALVVQWQDVQMKDNKPPGNFSFQVTLHKNGDIVFVYKTLPVSISQIPEADHPVKVGISDAFLIDKVALFIRRKTIYDYHRLNMKDVKEIKNQTAIYLKALPTCNLYETCSVCAEGPPSLGCIWCPAAKRCSNGFDRRRQEWLSYQCDKVVKTECAVASTTAKPDDRQPMISVESNSSRQMMPDKGDTRAAEGGTAFVTFLMFLALTSGIGLWAFYAYRNPHTPSGQLLIKYRPGNWRWQNAETRYTAASIHM